MPKPASPPLEPPSKPRPARLTDEQILERFGPLIWDALQAFGTDPSYFTAMCDAANLADLHRGHYPAGWFTTPKKARG